MEKENILLHKLNADCLIEICKYLSFFEKTKFLGVCSYPQLQSCRSVIFKNYETMDVSKHEDIPSDCSREGIKNIYESLGGQVRILKSVPQNHLKDHLIAASLYLENLEELHLQSVQLKDFPQTVRFRFLKRLQLRHSSLDKKTLDMVPNISELSLYKTSEFDSCDEFTYLPNLQSVFISYCFKTNIVMETVSMNRSLKHFTYICHQHHELINFLLENNMKSLKYLYSNYLDYVFFDKFESLEFLIVISKNKRLSLKNLLEKGNLKVLDVGSCVDFADNASDFEACLLNNKNLIYLNLPLSYFNDKHLQQLGDKLNLKPIENFDIDFNENYRVKFVVSDKNLKYFEYSALTMSFFERMSEVANKFWERKSLLVAPDLLKLCKIVYEPI